MNKKKILLMLSSIVIGISVSSIVLASSKVDFSKTAKDTGKKIKKAEVNITQENTDTAFEKFLSKSTSGIKIDDTPLEARIEKLRNVAQEIDINASFSDLKKKLTDYKEILRSILGYVRIHDSDKYNEHITQNDYDSARILVFHFNFLNEYEQKGKLTQKKLIEVAKIIKNDYNNWPLGPIESEIEETEEFEF